MDNFKNENLSFEERAEDLVSKMTVEECVSQMLFKSDEIKRFGIKSYNWWNEALHGVARCGVATVFPQAIGLAATFDDELIFKMAEIISNEGRAKFNMFQKYEDYGIYKGITFWSPNVNIFRDPRWGRGQETYGEDPYLTAKLGVAFVKGLQGNDEKYLKTAACAKHYAVHSGPENLRHEFNAIADKKDMYETYLPAFKKLVDANVEGVMGAYNRTNGEPCCGSETLIDILRNDWGFKGYFTSDCWAIGDFHLHHKITQNELESVALALKNGCDLNCGNMYKNLMPAFENGFISEEDIRKSVKNLVMTKMKLGMFDKKTPFDEIDYSIVDCDNHRQFNEEITRKSLVLLKNNGILPVNKEKLKNICVIGPNANSIVPLNGNYHGTANEYFTVLESIRKAVTDARVYYSKGSHLYEYKLEDPGYAGDCLSEVKTLVDLCDLCVLVVGMDETIEGEEILNNENFTGDKNDLLIPETQRNLINTVMDRNKPVIIVNMTGSSVDLLRGNDADAIIQAWYPGAVGGKAISDLIFGDYSPSGKLPITFYKNENILPDFEDYSMENRTYKFFKDEPLYPFGFGLSYTDFEYSNLVSEKSEIDKGESLKIKFKIKNIGNFFGDEVIQVYIKNMSASVRVPNYKLCGIKRISLKPSEYLEVSMELEPESFELIDNDGNSFYEQGEHTIYVGGFQPDELSEKLSGKKCSSIIVKVK